jgi:hypothetical protein
MIREVLEYNEELNEAEVKTSPCIICGKFSVLTVPADRLIRWKMGEYIQNAFSNLDADTREMLISGTHPKCWNEMNRDWENSN